MNAKRFGTRIDLQNNEILNMLFQKVNGLPTPTAALTGGTRFNTADGRFYVCNGTAWNLHATNSDALQGFSPTQLRDRSTHVGQQPASSISDLDVTVKGYPVSSFGAATGALAMGTQRITGLANGTANGDAVNKAQLDAVLQVAQSAAAGVAIKEPVIAAVTTNINITTPPTAFDGITIPANGRVLLAGQTIASENGIYVRPASGALVRSQDADQSGELAPGTQVYVNQGVQNADSAWAIISDVAITIGSTSQGWTKVPGSGGGSGSYTFGSGLEVVSSDVRVKAGFGITVADGSVAVDLAKIPQKYSGAVPAGVSPIVINHGLATSDLIALKVRDLLNGDLVEIGATVTGNNTVSLDFAVNPTAGQYRVALAG